MLVCSSQDGINPDRLHFYEVAVPGSGDLFPFDTLIDCRWVFTIRRADVPLETFQFRLPVTVMEEIDEALIIGLQMDSLPS